MSNSARFLVTAAIAALLFGCAPSSAQEHESGVISTERRVEPIPIEDMTDQQKRLLGIVDGEPLSKRAQTTLFPILMHHPDLMEVYDPMGYKVNTDPQIPAKQRELVIMRVAWLYQGKYEWARHYVNATKAGWTPDDIERIKLGPTAPGWSGFDRTLLKTADQLVRNAYIDDTTWADLREEYSVPDVMLLVTLVTHYHWVAMMSKSLEVEPDVEVRGFHKTAAPLIQEGSVAFVEGPATRSDGVVFFTDIPNSRILRRNTDGTIELHRDSSNNANGLFFDKSDNLLIAETGGRIVSENPNGNIRVLADGFNDANFNAPNDLALDTKGRIYFTDPAYRNRENATQRDESGKIVDGVYRIDAPGQIVRVVTHEVDSPNGIIVSPDDQYLYVADNNNRANGARQLVRFDLKSNGDVILETKKVLFDWGTDRGPDGMAIDVDGNLYVASGVNRPMPNRTSLHHKAGIYVISPQGNLLNFVAIPMDQVTNVTFGGTDYKTLFITAGHSLWSHRVDTPGYKPY